MTSQNSSDKITRKQRLPKWAWMVLLPVWAWMSFFMVNMAIGGVLWLLGRMGVSIAEEYHIVATMGLSVAVYGLALVVAIFVPWHAAKRRTSCRELGLTGLPAWLDVVLPLPAFVLYFMATALVIAVVSSLLPLDLYQPQQLPFEATAVSTHAQYAMVFFTLVILAPLAEELLFRGYLYGKLRNTTSVAGAIIITSITFGFAHLWVGSGELQWKVAIDTFVLSIFLCLLREYTGAIWASVLLHAIKNGLAFYLLFVNPFIIHEAAAAVRSIIGA